MRENMVLLVLVASYDSTEPMYPAGLTLLEWRRGAWLGCAHSAGLAAVGLQPGVCVYVCVCSWAPSFVACVTGQPLAGLCAITRPSVRSAGHAVSK